MNVRTHTAALAFAQWQGRTVLFSGGMDGQIFVWNPDDGQMLGRPFLAHTAGINSAVAGTMDGETVGISGGADSTLVVWRPSGEILKKIYIGAWILSIKATEDHRIVAGTAEGVVALRIPGLSFGGSQPF